MWRPAPLGVTALVVLVAAGSGGSARKLQSFAPSSIAFWDGQHGVLGSGATTCRACGSGTIQTTDDGGRTWKVRYRTHDRITDVAVSGEADAWAVIERCTSVRCDGHALLHSADGGRSWNALRAARTTAVSFGSARVGLGIREGPGTSHPVLIRTADGGRSWHRLGAPCRGDLQSVSLASVRRGWALCVGQPGAGNQDKTVVSTIDGGRTWHVRAGSRDRREGGLGSYGYPQGIAFRPGGAGVLWESRGFLFLTSNGGAKWHAASVAKPEIDFGRSASIVSRGTVFVLLHRGQKFRLVLAHDSGRTWRTLRRWG